MGSGEEVAICTGPANCPGLQQLGHPPGTKLPPWLPSPEPSGECDSLRGGSLWLMFNLLPPSTGHFSPRSPEHTGPARSTPAIRRAPDSQPGSGSGLHGVEHSRGRGSAAGLLTGGVAAGGILPGHS